jgi:hypothetical protein
MCFFAFLCDLIENRNDYFGTILVGLNPITKISQAEREGLNQNIYISQHGAWQV